jgi:hypothetical protein
MKIRRLPAQGYIRDLIAGVVAFSFCLQVLGLVLPNRPSLSLGGDAVAAAFSSGLICDGGGHDGGKTPAQQHHGQHCALCGLGARDFVLQSVALVATAMVLIPPKIQDARAWAPDLDELAPPPLGWISSWSSRAPPSFS